MVDAHRGHHGIDRRGDRRGPCAAGRHVELDVPVAPGVRLHLVPARPHHLGREVSENRGAARMQVEDRTRRGPGPRPEIQERERLLGAEGEQGGHEPPVPGTVSLLHLRLGRPGLYGLPGMPDGLVRVLRVVHEDRGYDSGGQVAPVDQPVPRGRHRHPGPRGGGRQAGDGQQEGPGSGPGRPTTHVGEVIGPPRG